MKHAIVLAAGLGTRMRPLTEKLPKPLVEVGGQPLIKYCFDQLKKIGVSNVVVNVHHLADQIEDYIKDHVEDTDALNIEISDERALLLNSGGGIKQALFQISEENIVVLNADTFWLDEHDDGSNLAQMTKLFDPDKMDILLMLVPLSQTTGHDGGGDFAMDAQGRLTRHRSQSDDALVYGGAVIINRSIIEKIDEDVFSLNLCFDDAISGGRLFGFKMSGHWVTVGTMEAIDVANRRLKDLKNGK